jgi:SAM-dependent methyltransferase
MMSTALIEEISAKPVSAPTACRGGCRFCGNPDLHLVVDLGMSPLCENFLSRDQLLAMEPFYPLRALFCEECGLMQVEEYVGGREIFDSQYMYFSSYSDSWLSHCKKYAEQMIDRFGLNAASLVVELASNDGYLLKNFVERGVPCLGIEPAQRVAEAARKIGVPTRVEYFGTEVARQMVAEGLQADLIPANNVLAHVPDLNDFVAGMKILLAKVGVITVEFPHLMNLIESNQFDTIYQEHYCYYSFTTVERIFAAHGITLFDVEELPTHGGSLRIFGRHSDNTALPVLPSVTIMRRRESEKGYHRLETYQAFAERVAEVKRGLLEFLINARREGKRVAAYGAPGKGNTLLNYCGIREDFVEYAVDRNPYKHGRFLPGTHIPVFPPERIAETRPDYVLILPWNLKDEIVNQLAYVRQWGAQFVVPIPQLSIC